MTILTTQDEDTGKIRQLRVKILSHQSPFSWNIPVMEISSDIYIRNQSEKCEVIEEEHQFQWTRFVPHLILSYELCDKKKDYSQALVHIKWCQDHWKSLRHSCKEPLFVALRVVLAHVIHVTKAYILLASGKVDLAEKEVAYLAKSSYDDVALLQTNKNRAGLEGLKAAVYLQYRQKTYERALEAAKEAINLDPDQAEWWFIKGNALCRMRRVSVNKELTPEEMEATEKAFTLQKDASYTVQLGLMYSDYAHQLLWKKENEKAKTYFIKAATRYREALMIRPDCINLKARVGSGLMRIRCKEAMDMPLAKQLLEEVVEASPNKAVAYADLGFYYSEIEKDVDKALSYYQKGFEGGSSKCINPLLSLKWKHGFEDQIIGDLEKGLSVYQEKEHQVMLYGYLGVSHVLIHNDWQQAIPCFKKALELEPSAKGLEKFKYFNGRPVNMLELITNHLHFTSDDEKNPTAESFLAFVAQKKPQNYQYNRKSHFMLWKKELEGIREKTIVKPKATTQDTKDVKEEEDCKKETSPESKLPQESKSLGLILNHIQELVTSVTNLASEKASKEEVQSIASDVEVIKEEVTGVNDKVEAIEPRLAGAEDRLEQLEAKVESLERGAMEGLSPEEVIREVNDRVRRASNVVLHNLPEDVDEPSIGKRISNDKKLVLKVSQTLNYDNYELDTSEIKLRRIGKPVKGKFRPLIVTFKNPNEAKSFLENLSVESVRDSDPSFSDFGISRDRTTREREHIKALRAELETRTSLGETDLTIKFIHGVPKILPKH